MRMMTDGDELTVRAKAGAGDAEAFRLLLERHYDQIYRLAYRFFCNRADAEDIAQDVCAALPKKLHRIPKDHTIQIILPLQESACSKTCSGDDR